MPPCSAIERSRLITRHTVRYGSQPQHRVQPPVPGRDRRGEQHGLHGEDLPQRRARTVGRTSESRATARAAACIPVRPVTSRTSLRRRLAARDRVADVQRDVGLVGAELLAVVRHVDPAVGVGRGEARVAEQPPPDEVVGLAVGEQQAVGGLVHQRGELGVGAAHQHEPDRPRPRSEADRRPQRRARSGRRARRHCSALRDDGIRRSSARKSACGRPSGRTRSVSRPGASSSRGNTMPPSRRDPITRSSIMPLPSSWPQSTAFTTPPTLPRRRADLPSTLGTVRAGHRSARRPRRCRRVEPEHVLAGQVSLVGGPVPGIAVPSPARLATATTSRSGACSRRSGHRGDRTRGRAAPQVPRARRSLGCCDRGPACPAADRCGSACGRWVVRRSAQQLLTTVSRGTPFGVSVIRSRPVALLLCNHDSNT